jgi:pilus assembly protein CpaC
MLRPILNTLGAAVVALAVLIPSQAGAETVAFPAIVTDAPQRLNLTAGSSVVIDTRAKLRRASLANPDVADAVIISPQQIYVTGKNIGSTTLTLWDENERVSTIFTIDVTPDQARLKEQLHELLPEEKGVQVLSSHGSLTLTGVVSSLANQAQVLTLAEAYAPKRVINLLQVGGVQQVMLDVRVAEMNRQLLRRLGVNINYLNKATNDFGITTLNALTSVLKPADATLAGNPSVAAAANPFAIGLSQAINALFRFNTGSVSWTGFIDALKQHNVVKILAEPSLVTLSGQDASFLAGGEFPYPVPQALGTTTLKFKQFGVAVLFKPTVLSNSKISIAVTPEVSELDFANAIAIQGFLIPSITTRRASTVVELGDGQSFAIAGLLRDTVREQISKYPVLGDIPILGALFRSTSFQKNETELIIIVTPHLVKPLDVEKQTLPTDFYLEPSDFDFYLMGKSGVDNKKRTETRMKRVANETGAGLEGEFGHIIP